MPGSEGPVSMRMAGFVLALLQHLGADALAVAGTLDSFRGRTEPPAWVSWDDYLALVDAAGALAGGAPGIARAMRQVAGKAVYSDFRALCRFFPDVMTSYEFVQHELNRDLMPARARVTRLGPHHARVAHWVPVGLRGSRLFWEGTVTLTELFPTHFDLPEAKVVVHEISDRTLDLEVEFPPASARAWNELVGAPLERLTQRERQVLDHVCEGLTNAEIAKTLGTAPSTVRNQISSILAKMDAVNRTELAARALKGR